MRRNLRKRRGEGDMKEEAQEEERRRRHEGGSPGRGEEQET